MDFEEVVKSRRSVRQFSDRDIPVEIIRKIIQAAICAPTPCNQQLWHFAVIKDAGIKEELINGAYCSTIIRKAPVIIVVVYDGWNYKEAIQATSMAVQNILLAATNYEVGSLVINSYGSDVKIRKILSIPDTYQICFFVCLGYTADIEKATEPVLRKDVDEVLHAEGFNALNILPHTYNPEGWQLQHIIEYQKYYCRKTFLGKEMDISHPLEKEIIENTLGAKQGPFLDLMTYDGCYLSTFPKSTIITMDLCKETMRYTEATDQDDHKTGYIHRVYDPSLPYLSDDRDVSTVTMLYKAERLSANVLSDMIKQSYQQLRKDGRLIIISRRNTLMFNVFYKSIIYLFGDDIRKTAIYAFFGPYKPIDSKVIKNLIKDAGFRRISENRYFLIPPFFERAYQMFRQYQRSGNSSYLHRKRTDDFIARMLSFLLKKQGMRKSIFGSVAVIDAEK